MRRKQYCDYLRIAATLAVIMIHISVQTSYMFTVHDYEWQVFNFYNSLVRWGAPAFVMISGALFLGKDIQVKKLYSKNALRLVTAFIFWSVFYAVMSNDSFEQGFVAGIKGHLGTVISGYYHMWFVLMMIGIYMCIPLYRKLTGDDNTMKYFLVLAFLFSCLIPWCIRLVSDFVAFKSYAVQRLVESVNSNLANMSMHTVLGYSFYFVLGYYIDTVELSDRTRKMVYTGGVLGLALTVLLNIAGASLPAEYKAEYMGYFDVNVVLVTVAIFTLFKYHEFKNDKLNGSISSLAKYCFGVYLFHVFVIEKLSYFFGLRTTSYNAALSVPINAMIVFGISLLVSAILNRIPVIKEYCV